jgi:hypothetical protein
MALRARSGSGGRCAASYASYMGCSERKGSVDMRTRDPGGDYVHVASEKTNRKHAIHCVEAAWVPLQMTDSAETRKRKFEEGDDSATDSTSDSSWAPSSEEEEGEEASPPVVSTYQTRSRGPAPPKPENIDATMDRADDEVDKESDFSTTTSEDDEEEGEEEEEEECSDEEEDEEDTEDDGYSDDDSFITSEEEEEEEDSNNDGDNPSPDDAEDDEKPAVVESKCNDDETNGSA